jgi:hypothetical protein
MIGKRAERADQNIGRRVFIRGLEAYCVRHATPWEMTRMHWVRRHS